MAFGDFNTSEEALLNGLDVLVGNNNLFLV